MDFIAVCIKNDEQKGSSLKNQRICALEAKKKSLNEFEEDKNIWLQKRDDDGLASSAAAPFAFLAPFSKLSLLPSFSRRKERGGRRFIDRRRSR